MKTHADTLFPLPNNVADITCMDHGRAPVVAEKVCETGRLIGIVLQNGVSKSKVMHDVQLMMKRGKNLGKALNNVMVRHHEALTCRSRDVHTSYVSPMPLEYQFSCSGSPPRPSSALSHVSKRRFSPTSTQIRRQQSHALCYSRESPGRRIVGLCRGNDALVGPSLEHCPAGRRVKITGSTSMLSDADQQEQEYQVDEAAEEFIEKFYRELRLQKWLDHYC